MALDIAFFRRVMGQFTTGVTIVTTRSQEAIAGLTVNSFTSVSLNPLLILVCIDLRSQSLTLIREGGVFAVNILSQEQEALSNYFASSSDERYNYFRRTPHHVAATGAPILTGTMGFIDARVTAEYPGGDHTVFLGQVEAMGYDGHTFFMPGISNENSTLPTLASPADLSGNNGSNGHKKAEHIPASPLLYYGGKYHHLSNRYQHQHPELSSTTTTNQHNEH
ncbi:MAG TPA: flavin reductase family protein [Ktedonobacteraceae bacterium]